MLGLVIHRDRKPAAAHEPWRNQLQPSSWGLEELGHSRLRCNMGHEADNLAEEDNFGIILHEMGSFSWFWSV
ncbi:hypothetical protein TURU_119659 [Turdus rufiventris]|nr:hypothetical protein TURU_119659 [Turdus rufiventris]